MRRVIPRAARTRAGVFGGGADAPRRRPPVVALTALLGASVAAVIVAAAEPFAAQLLGPGHDARAYWEASIKDPYANSRSGALGAYLYSPAFAQLVAPLRVLPWDAFLAGWSALLLGALFALVGPLLFAPVLLLALPEVWGGNIHLLLALCVVAGFRWPQVWAFVLLTKVTPGIGLLWFAARGEWKALGQAVGATLSVVLISLVLAPSLWVQWVGVLATNSALDTVPGSIPIPLELRLPAAAALIVYAARTDRRWLLPVGVLLALPHLWWGGISMLAGTVALERARVERTYLRVGARLRRRIGRQRQELRWAR